MKTRESWKQVDLGELLRWERLTFHGRIAFVGAVGVLLILLVAVGWGVSRSAPVAETPAPEAPAQTQLQAARDVCGGHPREASVGDEGRTLFLDGEGDMAGSGLTIDELVCYLNTLGTTDAIVHRMEQTRALDGTLTDSWDKFEATWTYHPDEGLDIIVEEK